MNGPNKRRGPTAFDLDDPRVRIAEPQPAPDDLVLSQAGLPAVVTPVARRRFRWGWIFWPSAATLVALATALSLIRLIEALFARSPSLGWAGLACAGLAGLAFLAVMLREGVSLWRLAAVDAMRERAAAAIASDDRNEGLALVAEMLVLSRRIPSLARARTRLEQHREDIIDGRDLVHLAERELMAPLDAEARRLITAAARRVSVVTALSPRAAIDILFVLVNALRLVRQLATLYGARPGALGLVRLIRHTVSHLTLTGGMAASDSLIQQVIGHGLAAKLSARLGEGVLNGLLTARLGLAAMEVTRPLPFSALPEPRLNDLAGHLLKSSDGAATSGPSAAKAG
jgi:putative membrane protein